MTDDEREIASLKENGRRKGLLESILYCRSREISVEAAILRELENQDSDFLRDVFVILIKEDDLSSAYSTAIPS